MAITIVIERRPSDSASGRAGTEQYVSTETVRSTRAALTRASAQTPHLRSRNSLTPRVRTATGARSAVLLRRRQRINARLVREGLALAYVAYSKMYVKKGARLPARFMGRRIRRSLELAPQGQASAHSRAARCPSESSLRDRGSALAGLHHQGQRKRQQTKSTHVQGQRTYVSAKMNSPRKRWFCTEE